MSNHFSLTQELPADLEKKIVNLKEQIKLAEHKKAAIEEDIKNRKKALSRCQALLEINREALPRTSRN